MKKFLFLLLISMSLNSSLWAVDNKFTDQLNKKFILTISNNVGYSINRMTERKSPTYQINKNENSKLLISPIPTDIRDTRKIKEIVEKEGSNLLSNAEEDTLIVLELKKQNTIGYYYTLTDKSYKPGEYKYLSQGYFLIPGGLVYFTFLNNDKQSKELLLLTDLFKSIEIKPDLTFKSPFSGIILNEKDFEAKVKFGNQLYLTTFQIYGYIKNPEIYEKIISKPTDVEVQSIESGDDKGSIIYIKYGENIEDKTGFLSGLFFGDNKSGSPEHPEEMFYKNDIIIILSYQVDSNLKSQIKKKIQSRL